MRNIYLHEAYDEHGDVNMDLADIISGHKRHTNLLPNLQLIDQQLCSHSDILCIEQARRGLYFSLLGSSQILTVNDIEAIQISYQEQDVIGDFIMAKDDATSLFQIHITAEQVATLFNETEEQVVQYFLDVFESINKGQKSLTLPITEKNKAVCHSMLTNQEQTLSLIGHVYSCIFTLVEQIKTLNHLIKCEDCQSKIFQAQNWLEVPNQPPIKIEQLAHHVGLNKDALTLGFQHLVGQSVGHYYMRSRINYAAAMLRKNPKSKPSVIAGSGFTESQFEAVFIQHFGISSHQYGQIH